MQLAAIIKARTLAFIEIDGLNKHGKIRLADLVSPIVSRYDFKSYPAKLEDFDVEGKGIEFLSGRLGDIVIDQFKIYSGLIFVETLSSTEDSRKVILDMLQWGKEDMGMTVDDRTIRQWAFVSHVTFFSEVSLLRDMSSPLGKLAEKTGRFVSDIFGESLTYHPLNFVVGHDPAARKNGIASFSIQQRANIPFRENKFFSEAPLPTDIHLRFLQELEADVMGSQ
jgi:hypothetical protein